MITSPPFSLQKSWICERAGISPKELAVIEGDEKVTFQQLYVRSASRAQQLRGLGIRQGDIVATLLAGGLLAVELFHAVQLCGATLLPLNIRLTASEIGFQLNETAAKILIAGEEAFVCVVREVYKNANCSARLVSCSENHELEWLDEKEHPTEPGQGIFPPVEHNSEIPWAILYTSGTTGLPKGVPLSARHFGASAMSSLSHLGAQGKDRWLACVPLFHIAGLSILTRSLLTGASVIIHDHFDSEKVSRAIDEQQITLLSLVPTMLHRLVGVRLACNKKTAFPLRAVLIGGAPCSEALRQQSLDLGLPVLRTYGLTEACSQVATEALADSHSSPLQLPRPLPGIQIKIVDASGQSVNACEEGEILVRGKMVMDRYYKRPEETAKTLQDGWLHTGDIGFLDKQGGLCVLNRRRDLIVTGGENVYPAEVEACLALHPAVFEACITGEDEPEFGQRVVGWVVLRETAKATAEELQQHCRSTLAGYKIPRRIIFLPRLPRNVSGKIMRQDLKSILQYPLS